MQPSEDRIEVRRLANGQLLALHFQSGALLDAANVTEAHLVALLDLWPRLPVVLRGQAVKLVEQLWAEGFAVRRVVE